MNKNMLIEKYKLTKALLLKKCRRDFWTFCKTVSPDFYKEDRVYLKNYCIVLQALYERRIINIDESLLKEANIKYIKLVDERFCIILDINDLEKLKMSEYSLITIKNLILNLPPQHGKSRTLINFCGWCLGKNQSERILTVSYNESTASDFSKYTRDLICEQSIDNTIIYSDIFKDVEIKYGSASYMKWALKGQHFNYLGTGIGGSVTSKSGTLRIIDDPIRGIDEAYNDLCLDKVWNFYTGTFLSRQSGDHIDIINHTRWSDKDLCGRLLALEGDKWFVFKLEAYDKNTDTMLCDELLDKDNYNTLKKLTPPEIFYANYHQRTISVENRLYPFFKTYEYLPEDYEQTIAVIDTADEGKDYLCMIIAKIKEAKIYVLDIYYTQDNMEITEKQTAYRLNKYMVDICHIESNNGGRGFARKVEELLRSEHNNLYTLIKWFHQTQNKKSRIFSMSTYVCENIFYPDNWNNLFPEYYLSMSTYSRKGKNKFDDAQDCTTLLVEKVVVRRRLGWD